MMTKTLIILFAVVFSSLVVFPGCNKSPQGAHERDGQKAQTIYYCPMHPSYTSDKPGECPICGMDLVPMEESEGPRDEGETKDSSAFKLSDERRQLIGVKTDVVKKKEAIKKIRTAGTVAFNPDLATAQREYLEAKKLGDGKLTAAARKRLILLGMNDTGIDNLKGVQKGLYEPGKESWVYPVVYESDLPFVKVGQDVSVTLMGSVNLKGKVKSIDSVIDKMTRSARLHVEVQNDGQTVRPDSYGIASIEINLGEKLLVPKSAVIRTGERDTAFLVHDGGHFEPVEVKLGAELEDEYVVEAGIDEGQTIVSSATFLIDSESRLKAAISGAATAGEHKH